MLNALGSWWMPKKHLNRDQDLVLTQKKIIVSVWDFKGIIHYELLNQSQTITKEL